MAFTATPTDGSSTPIPLSSVVPDGTNTPIALEGGPSLSSGGNTLAPASVYLKDGNNITQGAKGDSAATDNTSNWSVVSLLMAMWGFLHTLSGIVSGSKAAVKTAAGDIADLTHGQGTMSASVPVTIASDQTPKTSATATRTNVAAATSDTSLLASNSSRKGAIFFNDSTAILYLAYGAGAASTTSYSVQVGANGYFELPLEPVFTGAIRGIWSAANGNLRITELS